MIYLQLFWVFFQIGLFGFGGGYAMLSLIQGEVVTHYGWISAAKFTDIVAISQMTPGPIGINSATYIGYTVTGSVWGSVLSTFAVMLPSFILVLLISFFFMRFRHNKYVEAIFVGVRPATIGLIASAALLLALNPDAVINFFAQPSFSGLDRMVVKENFIDWKSLVLFVLGFWATVSKKIHPILIIILAGIAGLILY
ncbi:chromate transporter [Porphyromonas macacae]|uniref:Chromate transporter, chromate ion transporter (CHR) family n=1 Tax=Porphyromonas macacae TaxID=28115 RepID=A0A379DJQ4_9PORP|nr:chromate transporter [Porphyromonas macacae]KGN99905.1 chromate transporter [Porphyromonas macacae]SUB78243.1 chromate transporter, chromate ion transporter (CHR) family [Porphyromonas macacae]